MKTKMNKAQKIKALERQKEQAEKMIRSLRQNAIGANQLQMATDAVLLAIAKTYGEKRAENGEVLGYRMEFDMPDTKELKHYNIRAEKKDGKMVVGAVYLDENERCRMRQELPKQ